MPITAAEVRYRFALELSAGGRRLHQAALEKEDFARFAEATFFAGLRRGAFTEYSPALDRARIEPCFGSGPHVQAFDVVLPTGSGEVRQRFTPEAFRTLVRQTGARLALAGRVAADATLAYRLTAFADEPAPRRGGLAIELEAEPTTIPIREGSRNSHGPAEAWDAPRPEEFPVLIPRHVLEESVAEARRQPGQEVGGVLLGHLRRGRDTAELYLEVSCLVPCEETQATALSVTFTHATWARVREVVDWRGEGELIVGWMHSHPFRLCAECPNPVPVECQAKVLFYSTDDEFLMELTFPRPFMVGLLAAVEPRLEAALGHLPVRLFGWRDGLIAPRGFEVIDS